MKPNAAAPRGPPAAGPSMSRLPERPLAAGPQTVRPYSGEEPHIPEHVPGAPESLFRKRLRKFRRIRRGYYSFLVVVIAYGVSFLLPVLANNVALVVHYNGRYYF